MHDDQELDRLINSAISTYAEPNPGIEDRVLSSMAEARSFVPVIVPRRRWLMWAVPLSLAACLLVVLFTMKRTSPPPAAVQLQPLQTATAPDQSRPAVSLRRSPVQSAKRPANIQKPAARRAVAKSGRLPKLDIFPAPQPLTPEEQMLYAFATQIPEKQRQAVLEAQKNADAPLNIAAIRIPPLEMPEEGKN